MWEICPIVRCRSDLYCSAKGVLCIMQVLMSPLNLRKRFFSYWCIIWHEFRALETTIFQFSPARSFSRVFALFKTPNSVKFANSFFNYRKFSLTVSHRYTVTVLLCFEAETKITVSNYSKLFGPRKWSWKLQWITGFNMISHTGKFFITIIRENYYGSPQLTRQPIYKTEDFCLAQFWILRLLERICSNWCIANGLDFQ